MSDGLLERFITRVLKVPPRPEPPMGGAGSLRLFNAARGFFHYRLLGWFIRQAGTAAGLVVGLVFLDTIEFGAAWMLTGFARVIEVVGIGGYLAQLPFSFLLVRLDYRYRWYMVTDTSLRIREGLLSIREQTMTFANIQNLSIRQGPLQRLFGIADLRVRTAGGGEHSQEGKEISESANMHLGYFRGVDNAEEIRDLIVDRMRGQRDAGLGDPDEVVSLPKGAAALQPDVHDLVIAARELRDETRLLGTALDRG
jgi:membrane protein YdbS with pleckstrin-like domain